MANENNEEEKETYLKKLENIPCFRKTFLTSIPSGIITGLAYFMFTSKSRIATHIGYGTFFTVTLGYWIHCRYQYSVAKFNYKQIQQGAQAYNLWEGTGKDPTVSAKKET